uniref:Pollen allergen Cyn d 15 n=1 Tax=Cynodon dactylon TaxID=28909 RepID=Q7XYF2_CYNDA|nr:pollen allergen Cyn d 15 [Cynodon dactylon]
MATLTFPVLLATMVGHAWCVNIIFHVEESSPKFALSIKDSAKEITQVDVREHGADNMDPMTKSGDSWTIDKPLKGPLNIRLRAEGGGSRVQDDVIPENWKAGTDYPTKLHFG